MAKNGITAGAIAVFGKRTPNFSRTEECHLDTAVFVTSVENPVTLCTSRELSRLLYHGASFIITGQ